MKRKIIIFIIFLIVSFTADAQKHTFYGTTGNSYSLAYELTLSDLDKEDQSTRIGLKINAGQGFRLTLFNEDESDYKTTYYGGGIFALFGKERDVFELSGGLNYASRTKDGVDDGDYILLMANVGYRREMGPIVLRTGLGLPELIYVSAGFTF